MEMHNFIMEELESVEVTLADFLIDLHGGDPAAQEFLDKLATKLEEMEND